MDGIFSSLSALESFGIAGLICIVFGGIIWKMFDILEKKDDRQNTLIAEFRKDIKDNREARSRDAEQVTKAVEHLTTVVSLIRSK